jgi:hypothetical protein
MLKIGTLGLGGLNLSSLLEARARAAEAGVALKNRSVVLLFLEGSAPHVETFDPKMSAPAEFRSMSGEVQTSIPGVTLGATFPEMARVAHRMAFVRSFHHGDSEHLSASKLMSSGENRTGGCMASLYALLAGISNPTTGMPNSVVVKPASAGDQYRSISSKADRITQVGSLGPSYIPFDSSPGGVALQNMELQIARDRLFDRRGLLTALDRLRKQAETTGGLESVDEFRNQAFDVILGSAADAFDLSKEDPRTLEMYDTASFDIPKSMQMKDISPIALGKQMLLARRLCEAGCGFITVTSGGWDMHIGLENRLPYLGGAVDRAVSAFVRDVEQRGLSDEILLIVTGEFGRTPRINKMAGRDHWSNLSTLALSGGGLKMGQVVGQSDRRVSFPVSDPITPANLLGTIMHSLFDIGTLQAARGVPPDVFSVVKTCVPISQLVT